MTDVLQKFSHNGYPSIFQPNPTSTLFQMSPTESMEEILSKVCFNKNEPMKMTTSLSSFDVTRSKLFLPVDKKKVYFCQRCLNHKYNAPRKNHKSDCPFANCKCDLCILVEKRRNLNSKLSHLVPAKPSDGLNDDGNDDDPESYKQDNGSPQRNGKERVPNCQKCGQHGKKSRLKGHKRVCPFRECDCYKCQVVTERQKLMADQIKIRRRQKKDNLMNMTRDHITSQIQAAAALSAASGLTQFSFSAINNALLYQLKTVPNSLLTPPASSDGSSYSPQSSLGSAFSAPTSTPEILKTPVSLISPSPPSPVQNGIVAPVAVNPATPNTQSAFSFPLTLGSDALLQTLLANYKLLEPKLEADAMDLSNTVIDVCTV